MWYQRKDNCTLFSILDFNENNSRGCCSLEYRGIAQVKQFSPRCPTVKSMRCISNCGDNEVQYFSIGSPQQTVQLSKPHDSGVEQARYKNLCQHVPLVEPRYP